MPQGKLWYETLFTHVFVFSTGRGLSVLFRLPSNHAILYDLGRSDDFSPRQFIHARLMPKLCKFTNIGDSKERCFAQVILSHPHADHVQEISPSEDAKGICGNYPQTALWTCPHDREYPPEYISEYIDEKVDFSRVITDDNKDLIRLYRLAYEKRTLPLQTIRLRESCVPNVEYGVFYVRPSSCAKLHPESDQDYCNALSLVLFYRHGNQSIVVPGDITPTAFEKVLACDRDVERRYSYLSSQSGGYTGWKHTSDCPKLGDLLKQYGLSVLVTPHHGLESGFCTNLYDHIMDRKPDLNVVSERRHTGDSDGTVDPRYSSGDYAKGLSVDIDGNTEERYRVSTSNGHHMMIVFRGTDMKPQIYLRRDPLDLLAIRF